MSAAAARVERAFTPDPITEPTVTYDAKNQVVSATVIVSLPPDLTDLVYAAPLIGVPGPGELGPTWTVLWNLIAGEGLSSVFFPSSDGIVLPSPGTSLPPNVQNLESHLGSVDTQWIVVLRNTVTDVNMLNYDITATGASFAITPLSFTTTTHDPTIVVTKDPIG